MREHVFLLDSVSTGDVLGELQLAGFSPEHFIDATSANPFEIQFRSRTSPAISVSFVKDKRTRVNYLAINGPQIAALRESLETSLPHYDRNTAYERASSDPSLDERVLGLFHLALARGPVPEPRILRLLEVFFSHTESVMRQAAVIAAAYFEWPDAAPFLDALIAHETDAQILADAKLVRSRFQSADDQPITGFDRVAVPVGEHKDTVWALRESDGTYRIASIPQEAKNLSLLDVVEVAPYGGMNLMIRILAKSGHRTVRADISAGSDTVEVLLQKHGARIEVQRSGRVGIDVPPEADLLALTRDLDGQACPGHK